MGICLCKSVDDRSEGASRRDTSRKRSRSGFGPSSGRSYTDRGGSSYHMPAPDFGINSLYRVLKLLGEGGTGQTWLCQDLKTHRRVAIKFIPRPLAKVLVPMVSQEIQLQAQLSEGHLGLVRLESALLSKSHLGLVMEYIDGGTLTQYVTKRASNKGERGGLHLTEDEARYFFRQLVAAVEYLHGSHVAHRDLKMCNVVLTERRPPTLKLCDFGFAKGWDDSSMMNTRIGTPVYMSPQLIASKTEGKTYSATAADVWACGVMLFAMLLGRFPYDHVGHPDPNSSGAHFEVWNEQMKLSNGNWQMAPRVAPHVNLLSEDCKDLLGRMLETNEKLRITIPEIRNHAWFQTELPPYLDEAIQDFEGRQARLAKVMEAATEEQIKRRNKAVHDLIVMAGQPYKSEPTKTVGSGAISAIFEFGTEGDGASVASTGNNVQSLPQAPSLPALPARGPDMAQELKQQQSMGGGTSSDGRGLDMKMEPEVILVDLAAVAARTKSDGLVLMPAFDSEGVRNCNCNCDSDSSDQVVESGCAGRATATTAARALGGGGGGGGGGVSSEEGTQQQASRALGNTESASSGVAVSGEIQGFNDTRESPSEGTASTTIAVAGAVSATAASTPRADDEQKKATVLASDDCHVEHSLNAEKIKLEVMGTESTVAEQAGREESAAPEPSPQLAPAPAEATTSPFSRPEAQNPRHGRQ